MPKLPKAIEKAANEAELQGGFVLPPAGYYKAICKEIDTSKNSAAGNPKWIFVWTLEEKLDGEDAGAVDGNPQIWEHAALTEAAAWKLKQIFAAMGFELNSNSDELIGEYVGVVVIHQPDNKNPEVTRANASSYFDLDESTSVMEAAGIS